MAKSCQEDITDIFPKLIVSLMVIASVAVLPSYSHSVSTNSTKKLSEPQFAVKLRNPCDIVNISLLELDAQTIEDYELKRQILLNEMKGKAAFVKDLSYTILKTKIYHDCSSLRLPPVAAIPSKEYVAANEPVAVLRTHYISLVNHTAFVFFMVDQLEKYSSDITCSDINLIRSMQSLARNMRQLICLLNISIVSVQVHLNLISSPENDVLKELPQDQPVCSIRFYRDCQIVSSTAAFLQRLYTFLRSARIVNPPKFPRYPRGCTEL